MQAKISIPDDLTFADLHLARDPDGAVSFDTEVIERICEASNLPESFLYASEDNVSSLIACWYDLHRQYGGAADPVYEDLIFEAVTEELAGQPVSHQPGRA